MSGGVELEDDGPNVSTASDAFAFAGHAEAGMVGEIAFG